MEGDTIAVPLARGRLLWIFGFLLGFALLTVGLVVTVARLGKLDVQLAGFAALVLLPLVVGCTWSARRLARGAAGLLVDRRGITDASTLGAPVFVAWHDIVGFEQVRGVDLFNNTDQRIIRIRIRRTSASEDEQWINATHLRIDFDELFALLRREWARHADDSPARPASAQ